MEQNKVSKEEKMEILPEDRIMLKPGAFADDYYPTEEEYQQMTQGNGSANLGNANRIPHPNEIALNPDYAVKPPIVKREKVNPLLAGIPTEGESQKRKKNALLDGIEEENFKQKAPVNPDLELITRLLTNCKKSEFEIDFNLKVKLPYIKFFDIFDDDFVNKNEELIFDEITKLIDQKLITEQLKEKVKEIYDVQ